MLVEAADSIFCFVSFLASPYSLWDLSPQIRDRTKPPAWEPQSLNYWTTREAPFQCACLVNPRDGGAWWAAVYGVAQSQTRLKQQQQQGSPC